MCQNPASKKLFQIISRTERGLENAQDDFNGKTGFQELFDYSAFNLCYQTFKMSGRLLENQSCQKSIILKERVYAK